MTVIHKRYGQAIQERRRSRCVLKQPTGQGVWQRNLAANFPIVYHYHVLCGNFRSKEAPLGPRRFWVMTNLLSNTRLSCRSRRPAGASCPFLCFAVWAAFCLVGSRASSQEPVADTPIAKIP